MKYYFIDEFLKKIKVDDMALILDMQAKGFLVPDNETELGSPLYSSRLVKSFESLYEAYVINSTMSLSEETQEKVIVSKESSQKEIPKEEPKETIKEETKTETISLKTDAAKSYQDTAIKEETKTVSEEKQDNAVLLSKDTNEKTKTSITPKETNNKGAKTSLLPKKDKAKPLVSKDKNTDNGLLKKLKKKEKEETTVLEDKTQTDEYKKNLEESLAILEGKNTEPQEKQESTKETKEKLSPRLETEKPKSTLEKIEEFQRANKSAIESNNVVVSQIETKKNQKLDKIRESLAVNQVRNQSDLEKATRHSKKYG